MPVGSGTMLGFGTRIAYGLETTWGTALTATNYLEFRSENFNKEIVSEKIESLGTGRAIGRRVQKEINVNGTVSFDLHPVDGISLIKQALMGTVTSAQQGATGAYLHTFTVGDLSTITQKGTTWQIQPDANTTTSYAYSGCRVNSMKISAAVGEPVKTEFTFIGKDATTLAFATLTVAYSPVRPFLFQDGTFFYDGTTASITATSNELITSFEMTIENNLDNTEKARSIGSTTLTNLPPGRRNVMLSIVQRFDTTTAWDRFRNNTQGAVRLKFDTGVTIGAVAAATTYTMVIDFPQVFYNTPKVEIGDAGIITHDVEMVTLADTITGAGTDLIITVNNSATSYA